jgi:hypothetical protein
MPAAMKRNSGHEKAFGVTGRGRGGNSRYGPREPPDISTPPNGKRRMVENASSRMIPPRCVLLTGVISSMFRHVRKDVLIIPGDYG